MGQKFSYPVESNSAVPMPEDENTVAFVSVDARNDIMVSYSAPPSLEVPPPPPVNEEEQAELNRTYGYDYWRVLRWGPQPSSSYNSLCVPDVSS